MKKVTVFSIIILALIFNGTSFAKNSSVVPMVSIRSPRDHAIIIDNTLDVEVWFSSKEKGEANVKYIRLELDGDEVFVYHNKANIKEGIHTFQLDITYLSLGEHALQAFAYQAEINAELEGKSPIVIFTKSDTSIPSRIIKNPDADPDGIFVDELTLITITAEINPDPDLVETDITLQRLNEFNYPAESLGYLHDDGLGGDLIADDNIYTLELNFNEPEPSEIRLRIFAEYTTNPAIISSAIIIVDAIIPISEEDFEIILTVEDAAAQEFERLKEFHDDDKARQLTVNWLKRQYGVEDAGISIDNDTIWILFSSGLEGGITTHPVGTKGNPQTLSTDSPVIPETVNAIVLAPFFDEFSVRGGDESDNIAQKLSQLWSPVSTVKNSAVTVDFMKTLSQYAVVSISSHGNINNKGQVQIFTREKATLLNRLQHIFDLMAGRVRISIVDGYYVITPSFIRRYGSSYPKSLIYISTCFSKANETMSNAFLDKGAYTYFGYDERVSPSFAYSIGTRLFDYLLEDRMTTGDAFIALGNKVDPEGPYYAKFLMTGRDDLVLAEKPVFTDESPTGEITDKKPVIQARIYSPSNIDIDLSTVVMTLDDSAVTPIITPAVGGSDITITYTPINDLDSGQHTVVVDAEDMIELSADQKTWTFELKEDEEFHETFPEGFPDGDEGVWAVNTSGDVIASANAGGGALLDFGAKGLATRTGKGGIRLNLPLSDGIRLKDAILGGVSVPYSYTAPNYYIGFIPIWNIQVSVYGYVGAPIFGEAVSRRNIEIPRNSTFGSGVISWSPLEDFNNMGYLPYFITRLQVEFKGWDGVTMVIEGFHSGI